MGGPRSKRATEKLYVTNSGEKTVSVINASTNQVMTSLSVGKYPGLLDIDPKINKIFVPNSGVNSVSVIS